MLVHVKGGRSGRCSDDCLHAPYWSQGSCGGRRSACSMQPGWQLLQITRHSCLETTRKSFIYTGVDEVERAQRQARRVPQAAEEAAAGMATAAAHLSYVQSKPARLHAPYRSWSRPGGRRSACSRRRRRRPLAGLRPRRRPQQPPPRPPCCRSAWLRRTRCSSWSARRQRCVCHLVRYSAKQCKPENASLNDAHSCHRCIHGVRAWWL